MNKNKIFQIAAWGIIIVSFMIAFALQKSPCFPEKVASHWNLNGQVDGYLSRFWGIFLMPIVSLAMFILFLFLPKIDPLKENYKEFETYYNGFILILTLFLFYLYLLTILWNYGLRFDMGRLMIPALGVLFFYSGFLVEKAKTNWFVGIRTPWTLNSQIVWDKTHKTGGKLFKACGLISVFGFLFPKYAFYFVTIPVAIASIFVFVYSYWLYRQNSLESKTG